MLMLNVPATVGLIVLATSDRQRALRARAFLPSDTAATAAALQFYAVGLLGYSIVRIASPTFYALGDSRTPVQISIASVAVNAVLNVVLVRVLGYRGLALGTSIAALVNAAVPAVAAARAPRRARRPARAELVRQDSHRFARDGNRGARRRSGTAPDGSPATRSPQQAVRLLRGNCCPLLLVARGLPRMCCAFASFARHWRWWRSAAVPRHRSCSADA